MATTTSRAAIVAAARTAIGTARRGTLANVPAVELAKPVVKAVIERSGLDAADFDDLVLAESMQGGGDSARYIAVALGLLDVPGLAVNRQCASSLSAIAVGAGQIASGMSRAILAGGMESLSTGPVMQKRKLFTIGWPVWICLIVFAVGWWLLNRTPFGQAVQAVLLGKSTPEAALRQTTNDVKGIFAASP